MPLNEEFLTEIRYRNGIETVVASYVNLLRRGTNLIGLCPFHNEKTPSLTLYPENGSFYCFGCGVGGDVITFIRDIENLDYMEAVRYLAERSGINMPEDGFDDSGRKLRQTVLEINREAAKFFHSCLLSENGKNAKEYLDARQLSDETINHFGIGYSPNSFDALTKHLKAKGFNESDIIISNVAGKSKNDNPYDRFRNRIMFPIIDLRGNVIGFGGRIMPGDEGAKYINTSDTPVFKKSKNIYALNFAKNSKEKALILAEGYMDVISMHQAGFTNAVAALGTAFTTEQALLLSRYTEEIIVTLDSDEAGQKATAKAISILAGTTLKVRVLQIEGGKDPDEYIKTFGADKFKALLDGSKNDIEYRLFKAKSKYDVNIDSGKMLYLNEAAIILSEQPEAIARDIYAGKLAAELGVSKDAIVKQTEETRKRKTKAIFTKQLKEFTAPPTRNDTVNPDKRNNQRAANAEETILAILMANPNLLKFAEERIKPSDFITAFNKKVYEMLEKQLQNGSFDLILLGKEFSSLEMGRIVAIQNKTISKNTVKHELTDCIKVIEEERENKELPKASEMKIDEWEETLKKIGRQKGSSN